MNFSKVFIEKPVMTTLVMVAVFIFGVFAYFNLPISDLPVVDFPIMTITASYPGANQSTMASAVASPIENECMKIPGIKSIISDNREGQSKITLTFELSRNIDLAAPDVQAAITRAQANLPDDLPAPPVYSKTNPTNTPVIYLTITSETLLAGKLYDYGNRTIGHRISMIEGVSGVDTWGAKSAIRIQVNPDKLASLDIGLGEVASALRKATVTIPAGSLSGKSSTFALEPKGQLLRAKDYQELIVAYRDKAPVKLGDVANCIDSLKNDLVNVTYGKAGGKVSSGVVVVAVSRASGSNTVKLSKKINAAVSELQEEMPGSVELSVFYDASDTIVESVNDVKITILIALFLVVLVIFLFLGRISDTIIPSVALPISIIATFAVMFILGFSLDTLSLMGLTLAVGFVVDDAIVVLENTVRLVEKGRKPLVAAIESAKEISGTVLSMTLALVTVFIPLVFMGGVVGRVFQEFAITVVAAIICSGIISLTLTPMMCSRMIKKNKKDSKTKLQNFTDRFVGAIKNKYADILKIILKHKFVSVVLWVICLLGTFIIFAFLSKAFIPEGDSGAIYGQMVSPLGISADRMQGFQSKVNNIFGNNSDIDKFISVTGTQPGADQSEGPFFAVLKPRKIRPGIDTVVGNLRQKTAQLTEGQAYIMAVPALALSSGADSTAVGSKYSYTLTGENQGQLYKAAFALEKKLKNISEFVDVQNSINLNMPQLKIDILRDRASTLGITAQDIESTLSLAYAGGKVTTYKTDIDQYDVILELMGEYRSGPDRLSLLYLYSPVTKQEVPLASVVKWSKTAGPQNVSHYNQMDSATISFSLKPGVSLGSATKLLDQATEDVLPPQINGSLMGEAQQFKDALKSFGILIIVAIVAMYLILGILYESYIHPFTILTTLPVAAFGGVLTLFLFNSQLSLYAYVGMFMLLGIVAKNGIMMVDFANHNLENNNMSDFEAIYDACLVRFRPILMTGVAAIMGAIPIAIGFGADGASRQPMGLIVAGGLIFSQVITLLVTPGFFLYMQGLQDKFRKTEKA